jgi:glycosyltransferase involved in cell wall biosynthesis
MEQAPGLVHLQFPFLLVDEPEGHDSVLELTSFPRGRTLFTVHAAVNVPIVDGLHYVFHTASLARRLAGELDPDHVTVCPSLVTPPAALPRRRSERLRLLWVSRNEEAKFHDELPWICDRLLALEPQIELRMIGRTRRLALPKHARLSIVDCPVESLAAEYAAADLFWYFPHTRLEETWCRTVTEAMSYGLPVVVAGWGAMVEQLAGGAGLVANEPAAVVDSVAHFARDTHGRSKASTAARLRAEALFEEAHDTLTSLYQRLAAHD